MSAELDPFDNLDPSSPEALNSYTERLRTVQLRHAQELQDSGLLDRAIDHHENKKRSLISQFAELSGIDSAEVPDSYVGPLHHVAVALHSQSFVKPYYRPAIRVKTSKQSESGSIRPLTVYIPLYSDAEGQKLAEEFTPEDVNMVWGMLTEILDLQAEGVLPEDLTDDYADIADPHNDGEPYKHFPPAY